MMINLLRGALESIRHHFIMNRLDDKDILYNIHTSTHSFTHPEIKETEGGCV